MMMMLLSSLRSATAVLALSIVATTTTALREENPVLIHNQAASPACTSEQVVDDLWRRYHSDDRCSRAGYNQFKKSLGKSQTHQKFKAVPGSYHANVPDRKTVYCPLQDMQEPMAEQGGGEMTMMQQGYDTTWIVENKATTPVVLTWMDNGVEKSAVNSAIQPPTADPQAILQPGQWKEIHTFEGHVFQAREVLPNGGGMGRVLVQHRAGLYPVGEKSQLVCDPTMDPEIVQPAFGRTPLDPKPLPLDCNQLSLGFRNRAGCPLHAYYVHAGTCQEVFKMHLGVATDAPDFHHDWSSNTKFETSFIGHTYVFRQPSTGLLVDRIEIQATEIRDCPTEGETEAVLSSATAAAISMGLAAQHGNSTTNGTAAVELNAATGDVLLAATTGVLSL